MPTKEPHGALLFFSVSTDNREPLEKAGIRFTHGSELSQIDAPRGWRWSTAISGEATQEEIQGKMWSTQAWEIRLLDPNGRERAGAVVWSYDGYVPPGSRFLTMRRFDHTVLFDGPNDEKAVIVITDGHSDIVYISEGVYCKDGCFDSLFSSEEPQKARNWLNDRYPNWTDPSAYWGA